MVVQYDLIATLKKSKKPHRLAKQTRVRADTVLVMGKDEEDLAKLCMSVCCAIQSRPWIREIDVRKRFVNVDLAFMESIDPWWVEMSASWRRDQ